MDEHLSGVCRGNQNIQRGKGEPGDSAIDREHLATILTDEEAAKSVCRFLDSLKWNSTFQGSEASEVTWEGTE